MSPPQPRLQSLIFEVTQRCNHACLHCYNVWQGENPLRLPYPRGELDTSQTLRLLDKALSETECSHITITGGEPLLRADLVELLSFLKARNVQTTLVSNGRLLDEPTVVKLLQSGIGLFELPLLSHQRSLHDQLSGAPGAWDSVLAAMAHIRLHRGQFAAAFVATRLNIANLYETMRLAAAFGGRAFMLNRFNAGGRGRNHLDLLLPTLEQVRQALATANATAVELHLPVACSIPIQPCLIDTSLYANLGFGFCAAGSERAYYTLDPLGNLRPCNHTDLILGNLLEESFAEITSPERLQAFTQAIPTFCTSCVRRLQCQGGCKAAALVCYGSLGAEEPFLRGNLDHAKILRA